MGDTEADKHRKAQRKAQSVYKKTAKGIATERRYRKTDKCKKAKRLWIIKNRWKAAVHQIVYNARKAGKLTKEPCQVCGTTRYVHAHHPDYSKPLEVQWLCVQHHVDIHRNLKEV